MKILGKYKDYYDYLQGILGQDELVVYDRRNAFPIDPTKKWGDDIDRQCLSNCNAFINFNIEKWFRKEPIYGDKKREIVKPWNAKKIIERRIYEDNIKGENWSKILNFRKSLPTYKEGQINHFVLEVGFYHYYFECERYLDDDDEKVVHLNYGLIDCVKIEKDKKISEAPICLVPCTYLPYSRWNNYDKFIIGDKEKEQKIDNPILYSTYIPKFIAPQDIWNQLYEYISSLRDKEFKDTRTNEQHIESNGFDKKISFRHRK